MVSPHTAAPAIYPDDDATDAEAGRLAPCLNPPLHPCANPNADPGYLPGDRPAPALAPPQAEPPAPDASASVVSGEHQGALDEPVAVSPGGSAAEAVLLEPHDEAPAEPYDDDVDSSPRPAHTQGKPAL